MQTREIAPEDAGLVRWTPLDGAPTGTNSPSAAPVPSTPPVVPTSLTDMLSARGMQADFTTYTPADEPAPAADAAPAASAATTDPDKAPPRLDAAAMQRWLTARVMPFAAQVADQVAGLYEDDAVDHLWFTERLVRGMLEAEARKRGPEGFALGEELRADILMSANTAVAAYHGTQPEELTQLQEAYDLLAAQILG